MNGHLPNNYDDDAFCDNKSLMIVKRAGDGSGITALISRQLQGKNGMHIDGIFLRVYFYFYYFLNSFSARLLVFFFISFFKRDFFLRE